MKQSPLLCPSSSCESGAQLIGIVLLNGQVAFSTTPSIVDDAFVQAAEAVGTPEQYFRFASPCAQGACGQWAENRCGVIENVLTERSHPSVGTELPDCLIRPNCRWFQQQGARACDVCPSVITDGRAPAEVYPA